MDGYTHLQHGFPPVYNADSRVLILGSFPSVKSREQQFYYGHPQNRFWKVLAAVVGDDMPQTVADKKAFLLRHHIALWDVVEECDIVGSSDASIRNVLPTDVPMLLAQAAVAAIYANGGKAYELYQKFLYEQTGRECIKLPSTSPANAAWSPERLIEAWGIVHSFL